MRGRRSLAALAAFSVLSIGLAACSSVGADSDSTATTGSGDTSDSTEQITLTVATFNEFGYEGLYQEYMDAHPNIKIEAKKAATSNEAQQNLKTALGAGSGAADIEAIEVDWLPELMQYPDQFTDLTSDAVEGRWLDWKTASATTTDGKLIGYGTDIGPEGVCYRSDLFEQAGLPTDREEVAALLEGDWDTYFSVGKQFTDATGIPWYDASVATFQGMVNQLANPLENSDGTPIPLADNTDIKDIYNTVLTQSVDNNLSAGLEQWSDDWVAAFQNDGFATMLCPGWMLGVIEGNAAGVTGWDIADVFPGGGGNWGGSFLTVPAQGKNIDAAVELAQWLTAPEQQIKAFEAKGTFPSQVEALSSETLLSQTNEFFNNAPTGQILANRADAVELQPYKGPNYFAIYNILADALNRVDVSGTDDASSSWDKALSDFDALGIG
ncbi:ABC transporter substrate-binding protein [Changpingibacter yushuensis]|uniref:ABC transporter substrate-binding protein n=1 Tax=Changpingibacter yushuensis TaxID=2758440 RepID=UPI0015F52293|nr:extracellular solute-binding protein [Changpingibacter yushuensis]